MYLKITYNNRLCMENRNKYKFSPIKYNRIL